LLPVVLVVDVEPLETLPSRVPVSVTTRVQAISSALFCE
jgi:hypothetical protein